MLLHDGLLLRSPSQNYLRQQPGRDVSYNLVSATAEYFVTLETAVTEASLSELEQVLNTMTEFTQGPCQANQEVFSAKQVLNAASEIISWSASDLEVSWAPSALCFIFYRYVYCFGCRLVASQRTCRSRVQRRVPQR